MIIKHYKIVCVYTINLAQSIQHLNTERMINEDRYLNQ